MVKETQPQEFSGFTKFMLVLIAVGVVGASYYALQTFGDTRINVQIDTNPTVAQGLLGHWTFNADGIDITLSGGWELAERRGAR